MIKISWIISILIVFIANIFGSIPISANEAHHQENKVNISDIYDLELMEANHLSFIGNDITEMTIEEVINDVFIETGADPALISISYYNYLDGSTYQLNDYQPRIAASIYKVPLAMLYLDIVNQGIYTMDTLIPVDDRALKSAGESGIIGLYTLEDLIYQTIIYSNNVTAWALIYDYLGGWPGFINMLNQYVDLSSVGHLAYQNTYFNTAILSYLFYIVATDPNYHYLVELLFQTEPRQLFTSYVKSGMANKYGRIEKIVNDAGIYYEEGQPIYHLIALTENTGDYFLEFLNLRVNEWVRANYLLD